MSAEAARALFTGGNSQVIRLDRGRCAILRFIGTNSQSLVDWLGQGLREFKGAVVVNARELSGIDATFVQLLLDYASRKNTIALVCPPPELLEVLDQMSARDPLPLVSGEEAILESGSIPDSLAQERMALQELESRFRINPLWRKVDPAQHRACALWGAEV